MAAQHTVMCLLARLLTVKSLLVTVLLLSLLPNTQGVSYYFAQNGDDSVNVPTSSAPWKSLEKLNAVMSNIKAGDSILFRKGDVFRGNITITVSGNVTHPLVLSSYGTSSVLPTISGSLSLDASTWQQSSSNVKYTTVPLPVRNAFVGGVTQTLARKPNVGEYFRTGAMAGSQLTCPNLTESAGYWVGATFRARDSDYTFAASTVTGHTKNGQGQGVLTLQDSSISFAVPGWGFYMENKLDILDTNGEYFFDAVTNRFYLWSPGAPSKVEASVYTNGISAKNQKFIHISNLIFSQQSANGIFLDGGANNLIDQCQFLGQDQGVLMNGETNTTISNCVFKDQVSHAIQFNNARSCNIVYNSIDGVGLYPAQGQTGVNGAVGINLANACSNINVNFNRITNVGYIGIRFDGVANHLEGNIVDRCMLTLSDGGGLYTWGDSSHAHVVKNNVIWNIQCNVFTTPYYAQGGGIGHCLYFDDYSYQNTILNNTLHSCFSSSLYIHDSPHNIIMYNVMYNSSTQLLFFDQFSVSTFNNTVSFNYLLNGQPSQMLVIETTVFDTTNAYATYAHNYYCSPYAGNLFQSQPNKDVVFYSFNSWVATKKSVGESMCPFSNFPLAKLLEYKGENLLADWAVAPRWGCYSPAAGCSVSNVNDSLCSYPNTAVSTCVRLTAPSGTPQTTVLANTYGFNVSVTTSPSFYELAFVAFSPVSHYFYAVPRSTVDYSNIGTSTDVFITDANKPVKIVNYITTTTKVLGRIDFETTVSQSALSLSQVSLRPCTAAPIDFRSTSAILLNPSGKPQAVTPAVIGQAHFDLTGKRITFPLTLPPFSSVAVVINGTADSSATVSPTTSQATTTIQATSQPTIGQSTTTQSTSQSTTAQSTSQSTSQSTTIQSTSQSTATGQPTTGGQSTTSAPQSPATQLLPSALVFLGCLCLLYI